MSNDELEDRMKNGKGDTQRPVDKDRFDQSYEEIFTQKYIKEMSDDIDRACLKTQRWALLSQIGLASFMYKLIALCFAIGVMKYILEN